MPARSPSPHHATASKPRCQSAARRSCSGWPWPHAQHLLGSHERGKQWVLREVLEVAPVARIAGEVHAAAEHYVEAEGMRLARQDSASFTRERGIERRSL